MYICQECGHEFAEPAAHPEHRYRGREIVETLHTHVCPRCYCPQFDEAIHCKGTDCGRPINPNEKYHLCAECTASVKPRFIKLLKENFTPSEIKLLNDLYEGEYFKI